MGANELFIVEYADGEIDDGQDMGGFTVYLDRASAEEAESCLEEDEEAQVVRFVRESEIQTYRAERDALAEQLESDRTRVAKHVSLINEELLRRGWLATSRGSYEWDDDKYREEFGAAYEAIRAELKPLEKISADWTGCPKTGPEIAKARLDLQVQVSELASQNERLRAAATYAMEECVDLIGTEAGASLERAIALTPPAALEELRLRERSIGAEEELRRLHEEWRTTFLLDRADAIRDARERGGRGVSEAEMRDPRKDPRPGDVMRIRNKVRHVTSVGVCVEGRRRVCYAQVTTKALSCYGERWDKAVKDAEVLNVAE
jgi:hypothetical protein